MGHDDCGSRPIWVAWRSPVATTIRHSCGRLIWSTWFREYQIVLGCRIAGFHYATCSLCFSSTSIARSIEVSTVRPAIVSILTRGREHSSPLHPRPSAHHRVSVAIWGESKADICVGRLDRFGRGGLQSRDNRATNSLCLCVAVFAKTAFNWFRTVAWDRPSWSAARSIEMPDAMMEASLVSACVRPNVSAKMDAGS